MVRALNPYIFYDLYPRFVHKNLVPGFEIPKVENKVINLNGIVFLAIYIGQDKSPAAK